MNETTITLDGANILRDGASFGTYDAERNSAHFESRFAPKLYPLIEAAIGQKPKYDYGTPNPPVEIHGYDIPGIPDRGIISTEDAKAERQRRQQSQSIDAPEKDPAMGDKTPAYVEWFRANHSEEQFKAKYGHRKFQPEP